MKKSLVTRSGLSREFDLASGWLDQAVARNGVAIARAQVGHVSGLH